MKPLQQIFKALVERPQTAVTSDRSRSQTAAVLTWVLGLGAAVLMAPLVYLAITGIVGLAAATALGLVAINGAPALALRLSHWRLGLMRSETRRNPMISLERQLIERREALGRASEQLNLALARIDGFVETATAHARTEPASRTRWDGRIAQALALRQRKLDALRQAAIAVEAFDREVQRARIEWSVVEAEQAMHAALGATRGDPLEQLLERTALDSVREQMNRAFAGLDTELALEDARVGAMQDRHTPAAIVIDAIEGVAATPRRTGGAS